MAAGKTALGEPVSHVAVRWVAVAIKSARTLLLAARTRGCLSRPGTSDTDFAATTRCRMRAYRPAGRAQQSDQGAYRVGDSEQRARSLATCRPSSPRAVAPPPRVRWNSSALPGNGHPRCRRQRTNGVAIVGDDASERTSAAAPNGPSSRACGDALAAVVSFTQSSPSANVETSPSSRRRTDPKRSVGLHTVRRGRLISPVHGGATSTAFAKLEPRRATQLR